MFFVNDILSAFGKMYLYNLGFPFRGKDTMLLHNLLWFLLQYIQFKIQFQGETQN